MIEEMDWGLVYALRSSKRKRMRFGTLWPLLPIQNTLSSLASLELCKTHPRGANTKQMVMMSLWQRM